MYDTHTKHLSHSCSIKADAFAQSSPQAPTWLWILLLHLYSGILRCFCWPCSMVDRCSIIRRLLELVRQSTCSMQSHSFHELRTALARVWGIAGEHACWDRRSLCEWSRHRYSSRVDQRMLLRRGRRFSWALTCPCDVRADAPVQKRGRDVHVRGLL